MVNKVLRPPNELELEKVYKPYLLMSKKRYIGKLWTKPEKHDYIDAKGVESVRRDNCLLLSECIKTLSDTLMDGQVLVY